MKKSTINAKRLKEARLYRKMTMEELADAIGINKQAISQFENEKASPEPFTLKKIADTLGFPYAFFGQPDVSLCSGNTYFRALYSSSKKDLAAQQIKARYLTHIYSVLSSKVKFPALDLPILPPSVTIEEAAQCVRSAWGLDERPILNMVSLLERHGILVGEIPTDGKKIDAFYQYNEINGEPIYCVVLGTDKDCFFRRQFDCAHELGHILLHERYEDLNEISRDDYRKREDQANAFAAALLLPAEAFKRDVSLYPNKLDFYKELKRKWGVSMAAMIMRAKNLKIISDNQYTYLMRQMSMKGYRANEPLDDDINCHRPKALQQAIDLLMAKDEYKGKQLLDMFEQHGIALSDTVVAELLNIDVERFKTTTEESNIITFPII